MSTTWNIDASHTILEFAVKHMAISTVKGRFKALSGTIQTNEAGVLENVDVVIDATSIDTNDAQRDGHLKSPDFFNTEKNPTLEFKSTNVQSKGGHEYSVTGDLTMNGVTKAITLEVETVTPIKDPWGMQRTAAAATGKLSRKEWGLTWSQTLEFGGLLVGDDVKIALEVEAVIPPAA